MKLTLKLILKNLIKDYCYISQTLQISEIKKYDLLQRLNYPYTTILLFNPEYHFIDYLKFGKALLVK